MEEKEIVTSVTYIAGLGPAKNGNVDEFGTLTLSEIWILVHI